MIIEAKDFAGKTNDGFQFGLADRSTIIKGLLKVVEGLIDYSILPQSIALNAKIGIDDYLLHDLTLTYAENNKPESIYIPEDIIGNLKDLLLKMEQANGN